MEMLWDCVSGGDIAGASRLLHPDVEFDGVLFDERPVRGREAYVRLINARFELFAQYTAGIREMLWSGPAAEALATRYGILGTATGSGVPIDYEGYVVWRYDDELPRWAVEYTDWDAAKAALTNVRPRPSD
jgi:SnoaL-like domain